MKNEKNNIIVIIIILLIITLGIFSWTFIKELQISLQTKIEQPVTTILNKREQELNLQTTVEQPTTTTSDQQEQELNLQTTVEQPAITILEKQEQKPNSQKNKTLTWNTFTYSDIKISLQYPEEKRDDDDLPGYITAIPFGKASGGLFDWTIPEQDIKELSINPSCDRLRNKFEEAKKREQFSDYDFYLNIIFNKPNLCGVIKNTDNIVFYVIGKDGGYEGIRIGSGLLIIEKDRAIVIEKLLPEKEINADLEIWENLYLKNNNISYVEFLSDESRKMNLLENRKLNELLQKPSATMYENFKILQKIASRVTTIKE